MEKEEEEEKEEIELIILFNGSFQYDIRSIWREGSAWSNGRRICNAQIETAFVLYDDQFFLSPLLQIFIGSFVGNGLLFFIILHIDRGWEYVEKSGIRNGTG